jgi:histidinol-phosphate aminotransferase
MTSTATPVTAAGFVERGTLRDQRVYRSADGADSVDSAGPRFDLSNNELALPPLPSVLAAIQGGLSGLDRYPDPGARALTDRVAAHLDLTPDHVAVGPGSAGVLQQILLALCGEGDEVVYAWPGFDAYPLLVAISGATSVRVPLTAAGDHDLEAMLDRVGPRTRVVVLCSPHNPTGTVIDPERLTCFLARLPDHVVTVLDEAYVEFHRGGDPGGRPPVVSGRRNVVVLRTFSKAYGLAGLRVGYAAGPPAVIATVRKAALPFGVTAIAEQAAIVSLNSGAELAERMAVVATARTELTVGLQALGLMVMPSQANFVWLPLTDSSEALTGTAAAGGVKVRACPGHGVRVSVGRSPAHHALLSALGRAKRTTWC